MSDELKKCVLFEDMEKLRADVLPKVADFTKMIELFIRDNGKMKECVAAFDESICTKANKHDIATLKQEVQDIFLKKKDFEVVAEQIE